MTRRTLAFWSVLVAALFAFAPLSTTRVRGQGAVRTGGTVLLKNATLVTVTKGTIQNGTIVLRDGRIAAIGQNVDVPPGAEVIGRLRRVHLAGHHRLPLAHRERLDQRGRHDRQVHDGGWRTSSIRSTSTSIVTSREA